MISALFRKSVGLFKFLPTFPASVQFSEYFNERDKHERVLYYDEASKDKRYLKLRDKWKVDLAKKQLRRARKVELDKLRVNYLNIHIEQAKTPP
jgi:hypothetical protein